MRLVRRFRERCDKRHIAELEKRKQNLTLAIEKDSINFGDVKKRLSELSQQIKILNADLKKMKANPNLLPPASKWNLGKFREQLMAFIELDRSKAIRSIADAFVEQVTLYPDKIDVGIVLFCPDDKSNIPSAPKMSPARNTKTAQTQSGSRFRGCKSDIGAEDEYRIKLMKFDIPKLHELIEIICVQK
jgi:hypothetical protein